MPDDQKTDTTSAAAAAATTDTAPDKVEIAPAAAAADWRATLPDALKTDATLGRYKDVPALAQAVIEQHKALSSGLTKIPGKDAKPEEIAAFREKLGVPKAAGDYEPPKLAEGHSWEPGAVDTFRGVFHTLGLTKEQASGIMSAYAEFEQTRMAGAGQQYADDLKTLAKAWGQPVFDRRAALASRAIDRFAPPGLKEFLDTSKLGDHPLLFQAWAAIGEQFAEDGLIEGRVSTVPTKEEAQAKIDAIRRDKAHPFNNANHPRHQDALDEVQNLTRLMLGQEGTKTVAIVG